MKKNLIVKMVAVIIFTALMSVGNMFAQLGKLQNVASMQAKISVAQTKAADTLTSILTDTKVPLILYPPSYLEQLQGMANGTLFPSMFMPAIRQNSPAPMNQTPTVQNYAVVDLGAQSYAYGINNDGTVVGTIENLWPPHAFKYSNHQMQDISQVTDGIFFNYANGINSSGVIAGSGYVSSDNNLRHALRYSNGTVEDLTPGLNYHCTATGINSPGQIAGYGQPQVHIEIRITPNDITFNQSEDAFLITGNIMKDLGTIDGFYSSQAFGINDAGQVVGSSYNNVQHVNHASVYSGNGPMIDLDDALGGNGYSVGYGINNNGVMVGVAYNAFIYDTANSQMMDLGALGDPNNYSEGLGINNNGVAVGDVYINSIYDNHAFVYSGGSMQDLNTMMFDPASGWDLQYATAINDNGQIVGYGINPDGYEHAFLLNPFTTPIYTGFHQFDTDSSVPTKFGYDDSIQYASPGTEDNYGLDGRAITVHYGCVLCSLASMLTSVSGFESMTPAQLNTALTDIPEGSVNAGYKNGCNMNWLAIETITHGVLRWIDSKPISASLADQSALDQYLDDHCWGNRYRVILQLEANGDPQKTHYIFVVGKTNGDWVVFDPGWGSAFDLNTSNPDSGLLGSLNGHLTGFKTMGVNRVFTVTGVETYQINAPSSGSFSEVAHSPVELLVTDPNGNRVGYDPITDSDVFEISGASYSRDYPILDADTDSGGAGDTSGIKTVSIPSPTGGSYSTTLIGTASGSYTLDSSIIWPRNSEVDQTVTGTTDVGVITTNSVFVITPPIITSSSIASGMFNLSFTAQANVSYAVQGVNSLLSTNWTSLTTVTATSTNATASVPVSDPNMMFYRVVSQ
jgi:probable HAF family extracellular repeat protein